MKENSSGLYVTITMSLISIKAKGLWYVILKIEKIEKKIVLLLGHHLLTYKHSAHEQLEYKIIKVQGSKLNIHETVTYHTYQLTITLSSTYCMTDPVLEIQTWGRWGPGLAAGLWPFSLRDTGGFDSCLSCWVLVALSQGTTGICWMQDAKSLLRCTRLLCPTVSTVIIGMGFGEVQLCWEWAETGKDKSWGDPKRMASLNWICLRVLSLVPRIQCTPYVRSKPEVFPVCARAHRPPAITLHAVWSPALCLS